MPSSKTAYRISLLFALCVIAFFVFTLSLPPLAPCGSLQAGYAPILAFELARSVPDLHAIFGAGPSACRAAITTGLNTINWVDSFFFIWVYTGFLIFFFLGTRVRSAALAWAGVGLAIVAAAGDSTENSFLFFLAANPDRMSVPLQLLPVATGIKWIALGILGAVGGFIIARDRGVYYLLTAACFAGLIGIVAAIAYPPAFGAQASNAIALSWIAFLIYDLRGAFSRSGS